MTLRPDLQRAIDERLAEREPEHELSFTPSPRGPWFGAKLQVDDEELNLRVLGSGNFTVAFRDDKQGDVYALTNASVRDKDAAEAAFKRDPTNPHLPAVQKLGSVDAGGMGVRSVYKMPYYKSPPPPDSKAELLGWDLDACANATWPPPGRNAVIDCARRKTDPNIVRALELLAEEGALRGNFEFEFPESNLAVDSQGNLVLLDVLYPIRPGPGY